MKRSHFNSLNTVVFAALLIFAAFLILYTGKTSAENKVDTNISEKGLAESRVFSEFDNWIKEYLGGNFSNKQEFIDSGRKLALERRELFKKLIETNPEAAIGKAISEDLRSSLPASISQFMEKSVSASGDFNVYAIDNFESSNTDNHSIEREVRLGGARYKAFVYGKKAAMTTKLDIPLRGIVLDDLIAVEEKSARKIEPSEFARKNVDRAKIMGNAIAAESGGKLMYFSNQENFDKYLADLENWESKPAPVRSADRLSSWTVGDKTILFIRIDFPDRPGEPTDRFGQPLTIVAAQSLIDGPVNDFYSANSYHKTSLHATVTPVIRMPQPQTAYPRDNLLLLITDARNAAFAAGFNTNDYDLDIAAYSYTPLYEFSGISPIGAKGAQLNGSFTFKTVTHEIGHEYGLAHANL